MSAKAVKNKRGRPRKVALESMVPETSEPAEEIRSTKSSTPKEVSGGSVKLTTKDALATTQSTPKTVSQASQSPLTSPATLPPTIAIPQLNAKLGNSKILNQVYALSSKLSPTESPSAEPPTRPGNTGNTPSKACVVPTPFLPLQSHSSSFRFSTSQPPTSGFPNPPSQIPPGNSSPTSITVVVKSTFIAAAKSRAASQRGLRSGMKAAGADRASGGASSLPPNYNSVARKVTMMLVAMPIAIFTSWLLYERCK